MKKRWSIGSGISNRTVFFVELFHLCIILMSFCYRSIIFECYHNKFSASKTLLFVKNALGSSSPCRSTFFKLFAEFKARRTTILDRKRSGRPPNILTAMKIKRILRRNKFSSARYIAKKGNISTRTTRRWLNRLGYKRMKIKAGRYPMTISATERRAEVSKQLLKELNQLSHIDVITSDESWFFLNYNYEWM